jgi:chemotaxis protein CheC
MNQEVVLVLQVDMSICQEHIEGHLVFVLSVSSLENLIHHVDEYLKSQGLV